MNSRRFKAVAVVTAIVALLFTPAAAFADYPPTGPQGGEITTNPDRTVTVTFTGFAANETVSLQLTGEEAASAPLSAIKTAVNSQTITKDAAANGDLPVTLTTAETAVNGDVYTLVASGQSGEATFLIHIVEDSSTGGTGSTGGSAALPRTGALASQGVLIGGGVLLLAGVAIVLFARRKTEQS